MLHYKKGIQNLRNIYNILLRKLRLIKVQRNILVFFVFLFIAIVFWFMQTLKEITTAQFTYDVKLVNVPKEVVFTSDIPQTITISVTGRGWAILQYWSQHERKVLEIDFDNIEKEESKLTLDNNIWRRLTHKEFNHNLKFLAALPGTIDIYYSNGITKRVPVKFNGKVSVEQQHLVCGIKLKPDSVDVIAPAYLLDSISEVLTESATFSQLDDTLTTYISLKTMTGIKVVPDSVRLRICVDLFTEKTLEVPIYCENIPENNILRTFPSKAKVTFNVSSTLFNKIMPQDFIVVVDYKDLKSGQDKCALRLREHPDNVSHIRISPEQIEYVIEQSLQ